MRRLMLVVLMAVAVSASAVGQQLDFKVLDKIAAKAKSTTEMGMDSSQFKSTTKNLDDKKPNEAAAKKSTETMTGYFLRSYEFKDGDFKIDDIKPLMDQLKAPNWVRFLRTKEENELTEIWWHMTNGEADGMLLVTAEENELTVINAMGTSNLDDLKKLGDFGKGKTYKKNK